jgi:iron complex transport system substrate-binding protein
MGVTATMTTTTRRTRGVLALAALLMMLTLTACGSEDSDDAPESAAQSAAFPVTLTTKQGPVKVATEPKRIVTLDFPSTDAVLALGVKPVAMAKVSYVPGDVQTWTKTALDDATPELLNTDTDIPLEKIAALQPDLIVGTGAYNLDPVYSKLSQLAPVVSYTKGPGVDSWQESTLLVGRALGREEQARKLVADTQARVAKAAADHPIFKGKTLTLFNYAEGQAYAISSVEDVSIRFLSTLGFKLPPAIVRAEATDKDDDFGEARLPVSDERLKLLDADVVLGTSSDSASSLKALVRRPLFQRLSAVKRDAYANLDIGPATSIAFPSVLSINDAIDNLVPILDRLTQ